MFKIILISALICAVYGRSINVGQTYELNGVKKVFEATYDANTIPFFKRVKEIEFEYTSPIKGITITDIDNGLAEPSIVLGGLGFKSVNIKLKSQRGEGFNFHVAIYA